MLNLYFNFCPDYRQLSLTSRVFDVSNEVKTKTRNFILSITKLVMTLITRSCARKTWNCFETKFCESTSLFIKLVRKLIKFVYAVDLPDVKHDSNNSITFSGMRTGIKRFQRYQVMMLYRCSNDEIEI